MKHYDDIEWVFYREKFFLDKKQAEMEEHLCTCDRCMEIFLSLIDKQEIDGVEESISENFTAGVMANIKNHQYKPKTNVKRTPTRYSDMFIYYVAVASVTIVLTLGGFYSSLVGMVPQAGKSTGRNNINASNVVSAVSEKIVSKTSSFINSFEIPRSGRKLK